MNTKKIIITILIIFLIINLSIHINNYAVDFISNQKPRENGFLIGAKPYEIQRDPETAVLLIHGITSTPKDFRNLADYLTSKNISIKAVLLPGHGTSPKDLSTKNYEDWTIDVEKEYNNIQSKNKFVLGYSLGGALTLDLAEKKNLNGIILIHAPIKLQTRFIPFIPLINLVQKYHLSKPEYIITAINDDRIAYDAVPLSSILELVKLIEQLRIERMTEPTLIVQTKQDELVAPESAEIIFNSISSRNKELIWLETSTHRKPSKKEEEQIMERIYQFIKENSK